MTAQKIKPKLTQSIILALVLIITTIGLANTFILTIKSKQSINEKSVLGTTTETNSRRVFWQDFLSKQPNYLPGWIELYKLEIENNNYEDAIKSFEKIKTLAPNLETKDLENLFNNQ